METLAEIPGEWAQPPAEYIGKLPKGGAMLDFVGHASLTKILLEIDPEWDWEPFALDEKGLPALDDEGNLWAKEDWAHSESPEAPENDVLPASQHQESRSPQKDKQKPPTAAQKPFCTECGAEIARGEKKQGKAGEWRHVECPSVAAVQEAFPGAQTVGTDKTEYDLNEEPF